MSAAAQEGAGVDGGMGRVALMAAAARAIEAHRPDALARDGYAEHFVRASRAGADWPVRPEQVPGGDDDPLWGRLSRYFGLRARVFDDFLLERATSGVRQSVILGAGLDSRAYRLDWPPRCAVFEIDLPTVLAFKHKVLEELGGPADGTPAERVAVPADLRLDWTPALLTAGFDPERPTTWVAEGLLPYMPPTAERRLLDAVVAHSAPGSALGCEVKHRMKPATADEYPLHRVARERIGVDLSALFNPEPRPSSSAALVARGWSVAVSTPFDHTWLHGRGPVPEVNDSLSENRWVFAAAGPA